MNEITKKITETYGYDLVAKDEEFIYIEDTRNYYISNYGRVFKDKYIAPDQKRNNNERFCKVFFKRGYKIVYITFKNGDTKDRRISVLMANAFLPNPDHFKFVNYKDGNPENCVLHNIEWASRQKPLHIVESKKVHSNPNTDKPFYYDQYVWVYDFGWRRYTNEEAANFYNIKISQILDVTNNPEKTGVIENISWLNRHNNQVPDSNTGEWHEAPPHLFDVKFTFITPEQCKFWYKS